MMLSFLMILLMPATLAAQTSPDSSASGGSNPAGAHLAADFRAAIERGYENPGTAYRLRTNCTDDKGIRAFELYPDGVAIWNRRTQLQVPESVRTGLLHLLLTGRFYELEPSYGGKKRLEEPHAGFRVSCQVWLEIGGMQKHSVQQADGEQSAQLKGLAAALLDRVEPLVKDGLSAENLQDGLEKLGRGELAPQTLRLRYIELPPKNAAATGFILRISDGSASRQAYYPGRQSGPQLTAPLRPCGLTRLSAAIQAAGMDSLPSNLWSDSQIELEVELLGHKKAVLARPFTRLNAQDMGVEQQKLDRLITFLRAFDPHLPASCED